MIKVNASKIFRENFVQSLYYSIFIFKKEAPRGKMNFVLIIIRDNL